jgi:virginiamycin A acetyltransferase
MRLGELVPDCIKDYVRLIQAKQRFPGRYIETPRIARDVQLGTPCLVHRGVLLGSGVVIDNYTYVNEGTLIGSGRIGRFCSIGAYVSIGMAEHPLHRGSTSPFTYGRRNIAGDPAGWNEFSSPPIIGHDVWIGGHSTVLQGVQVETGAVIAAGAIVTKNVPAYSIVAGVPARVSRFRFSPEQIVALIASKWWELPPGEIPERWAPILGPPSGPGPLAPAVVSEEHPAVAGRGRSF